jgi:Ca-activated chloride channel family protein
MTFQPPAASDRPTEVAGGDSFATAPVLADGAYRGSIVPGETQAFRIQLAYGQSLSARLRTPPATGTLADQVGLQGPFSSLRIHSPMRGDVPMSGDGINTGGFAASTSSGVLTVQTPQVRYNNRDSSLTTGTSLPGYYYLVYAADTDYQDRSFEMPFRLDLQVRGDEVGAPDYGEDQVVLTGTDAPLGAPVTAATDDPTDDPTEDPSDDPTDATSDGSVPADSTADEDDPISTGTLVAAGGLCVVALGCVALAVGLLRGRRG